MKGAIRRMEEARTDLQAAHDALMTACDERDDDRIPELQVAHGKAVEAFGQAEDLVADAAKTERRLQEAQLRRQNQEETVFNRGSEARFKSRRDEGLLNDREAAERHAQRTKLIRAGGRGQMERPDLQLVDHQEPGEQRWLWGALGVLPSEEQQQWSDAQRRAERRKSWTTRAAMNAGSVGIAADGGNLVGEEFSMNLIVEMAAYGELLMPGLLRTFTTMRGDDYDVATDTGRKGRKATIVGENTDIPAAKMAFGQVTLKSYEYADLIVWSHKLGRDSYIDYEMTARQNLAEGFGRAIGEHLAVGDGSGKPEGIVETTNNLDTGMLRLKLDHLRQLQDQINESYRRMGRYFFSPETRNLLRSENDNDGRPLWLLSVRDGDPMSLYGRPYTVVSDIANANPNQNTDGTANNIVAVFGALSQYYARRIVTDMEYMLLRERYADSKQVGLVFWCGHDGRYLSKDASAKLTLKT